MLFVYIVLILFRILGVVQRGYIHPDEFFQGGQELFFGCHPPMHHANDLSADGGLDLGIGDGATKAIPIIDNRIHGLLGGIDEVVATWEFQQEHALRSILPPLFMTMLPLRLYTFMKELSQSCSMDIDMKSNEKRHAHTQRNDGCDNDWKDSLTGWEIWVIPRIFMAILSIITLDIPLWYMATMIHWHRRQQRRRQEVQKDTRSITSSTMTFRKVPMEVMVFATSWVTLGFLIRPFTNTLETMVLSVLCFLAVYDYHHRHHQIPNEQTMIENQAPSIMHVYFLPLAVGITCAIGIFTRFTFVIFAFPVILALLYHRWIYTAPQSENRSHRTFSALREVVWTIAMIGVAFLSVTACFIYCDTLFYSSQSGSNQIKSSSHGTISFNFIEDIVITPWNALRYNSMTENLSGHGLHPRITHILANLPMLFGPLAIFFYISGIQRFMPIPRSLGGLEKRRSKNLARDETNDSLTVENMLFAILIMGLGILSLAPHQEPRFLLPVTTPLILLYARNFVDEEKNDHNKDRSTTKSRSKTWGFALWVIFNGILMTFFGGLHQGGVIPSLLALPSISRSSQVQQHQRHHESPLAIIYYRTYMPPSFLMRQHQDSIPPLCRSVPIIDLQGDSDATILLHTLRHIIPCQDDDDKIQAQIHLVMPRSCMDSILDMDTNGVCQNEEDSSTLLSCRSSSNVNTRSDLRTFMEYQWMELWSSPFQIATEDIPTVSRYEGFHQAALVFLHDSKFATYEIRCAV